MTPLVPKAALLTRQLGPITNLDVFGATLTAAKPNVWATSAPLGLVELEHIERTRDRVPLLSHLLFIVLLRRPLLHGRRRVAHTIPTTMSRRPNPAADRAEQNRQTLKSLVKIEANKSCADCKRNKRAYAMHIWELRCAYTEDRPPMGQLEPRHLRVHQVRLPPHSRPSGALTINRCSGIHRGMGTHISKVKSVDLDSWTDEQLQSVLKWGNARANKSVKLI